MKAKTSNTISGKKPKALILTSGGLDSSVLLADAARRYRRVLPVYVSEGLRWEEAELYWLKKFIATLGPAVEPLAVLSLDMKDVYGSHWSVTGKRAPGARTPDEAVYLPGRNVLLLAKTACLASLRGIGSIEIGTLAANPFPDATPAFFRRMAAALSSGMDFPFSIRAPFRRLAKEAVVRKGRSLGLRLDLTFSCLKPRGFRHCGACNKCAERRRAGLPL